MAKAINRYDASLRVDLLFAKLGLPLLALGVGNLFVSLNQRCTRDVLGEILVHVIHLNQIVGLADNK